MSIEATKWALNVRTGSVGRKAVLLVLAEHADSNGSNSFPGQETIAAQTEQSLDTVQRHIKALKADGIITGVRRYDQRGYRKNDGYELDLNRKACGLGDDSHDRKACGLGHVSKAAPGPSPKPQSCGLHIDEPPIEPPEESKSADAPSPSAHGPQTIDGGGVVDFTFQLWSEGTTILESLGLKEDRAKKMIGRWLKDTGNKHEQVLAAIRFARGERTRDPISLITASLKVATPFARSSKLDPRLEGARRVYDRMFGQSDDAVARPLA